MAQRGLAPRKNIPTKRKIIQTAAISPQRRHRTILIHMRLYSERVGNKMIYITVRQSPKYSQMTLEDFLFEAETKPQVVINPHISDTKTYEVASVSDRFSQYFDIPELVEKLKKFNVMYEPLRKKPREELYYTFHIPKKSGGLRRIDAPEPELMDALRALKTIFEEDFKALYHTSAFAYVKGRCILDAVKRHTRNDSQWYGKYDLSNFFGSTTLDYVIKMLSMIYPFSEVIKTKMGREELIKALELAFLNGGLPQGTPISPLITNIMMIPIDFKLANGFRELNGQRFTYTRYADDFIVSSRQSFSYREVENFIIKTLAEFEAPFTINTTKTRYGSRAGRNWNLGIMVNQDNKTTVGYKKKRQFQAMLSSYIMDKKNGKEWDRHDIQVMEGYRNYYRMIEGETIDGIVEHIANKFGVDIVRGRNGVNLQMIKDDLRV